jgi:hypothetical protein
MTTKDILKITNINAAAKDAGLTDFPTFLVLYGLKIWIMEDFLEGKAILREWGYGV